MKVTQTYKRIKTEMKDYFEAKEKGSE